MTFSVLIFEFFRESVYIMSKDKRTLHLVMVTTNGVAHNNYYNMVQKEINMDDLFAM